MEEWGKWGLDAQSVTGVASAPVQDFPVGVMTVTMVGTGVSVGSGVGVNVGVGVLVGVGVRSESVFRWGLGFG